MKKAVFIGLVLFISSKGFSQANETFIEEKSSAWIKISVAEPPVVRRSTRQNRTTATQKRETPVQQPASEKKSSDAFDKTNRQVKRFKKEN